MAPMTPRLRILSVGGNPVSAFLSWRLQATNACDVTLVWKTGFEHVSQYGISFSSPIFGNERFKPRHVVRVPEEAAIRRDGAFDYVILCIKALPDVYDLASVIDSVVTPQHTCILVNTTHSLGVESAIQERFTTNVVLSLVSGAELNQLGQSEFEHKGSTEVWIGPSRANTEIPLSIQSDMAQALAMTLSTGQVDCKVSTNIRQQQFERVIGPIAFHPLTVIFETPSYAALLDKVGVQPLVNDVMEELLGLATAQGCQLQQDFKQTILDTFAKMPGENIMWQDYVARRPMEVETYLGSPIKLSRETGTRVPRIETLYAILHNLNNVNRNRPKTELMAPPPPGPPALASPTHRVAALPAPRNGMSNGNGMMPRARPRGASQLGPPPGMRRPAPPMNGGPPNGLPRLSNVNGGRSHESRRGSLDGADLEEFSHLVLYDEIPDSNGSGPDYQASGADMALRERELQLRQRELALREHEMRMRRGGSACGPPGPVRRGPPPMRHGGRISDMVDEDDVEDDYFDAASTPAMPMIDPDNFDMMSVTSRKNRKALGAPNSAAQFRKNPEHEAMPPARSSRFRPNFGRNRASRIMGGMPSMHENILDDPLMNFTSNRYGNVDRGAMQAESRASSLTAARLDELQLCQGPPGMVKGSYPRRVSQSPANPYSPSIRGGGIVRPSPPNGLQGPPMMDGRRPSPATSMRQQMPRHPPGPGNAATPPQLEAHAGLGLKPPETKDARSVTGSASASAGSGESTQLDSEPSANSSQSSLGPRPAIGVP